MFNVKVELELDINIKLSLTNLQFIFLRAARVEIEPWHELQAGPSWL